MSHFTVMVVTDERPTDEVLAKVLMPWHEYECTGIEEYLQEIDKTDEVVEEFNKPVRVVALKDGTLVDRWDRQFYVKRPMTDEEKEKGPVFGDGTTSDFKLPDGAVEKEVPATEAREQGIGYKTLAECAEEEYGADVERDGRFYRRTNPNAKWDWWALGGRWIGLLIPKKSVIDGEEAVGIGQPGLFTEGRMRPAGVDFCQMGNLDIDKMRDDAGKKAGEEYDTVTAIIDGRKVEDFETVRKRHGDDIQKARDEYWAQPAVKDLQRAKDSEGRHIISPFFDPSEYAVTREQYVEKARRHAFTTHAVVMDGKWYERGAMGWFGVVHDEKDVRAWEDEFSYLIDELPKEKWVSIVYCHI